jgi:general secretion pathway protein D
VVESSNSLVLRGDPDAIARVLPLISELDRRAESSDDVRVVRLQHANAEQLLPVLQQLVGAPVTAPSPPTSGSTGGERRNPSRGPQTGQAAAAPAPPASGAPAGSGGPRANIARYPGTNALVIAAEPDVQRLLTEVIRQLDVRREQVLVEAIVVEVSDNAARQLGVQFILAGRDGNVPFAATNYSNTAPNILTLAGALAGGDAFGEDSGVVEGLRDAAVRSLLGANGLIGGFAGEINDDALFGFVLNAVRRDDASNILSTPSIMTLDNEEATILVGQEVPITTGEVLGDNNANPFRTTQRQNVGVQLEVKPQINAGGGITLFLRQEVSSVNGASSAAFEEVVLDKREIETTVLVDDGDIIVLGGLLDQSERTSTQKVPFLGDLPVVGNLFRSTGRERAKRNLMVFIRPTIVRSTRDAQAVTAPRYDYVRRDQIGASREGVSSLDELIDQYMRTTPPQPPGPAPAPPPVAPAGVTSVPLPPPPGAAR